MVNKTPLTTDILLYGADTTPRIVAAEFVGPDQITTFARGADGSLIQETESFRPWLLAVRVEPWSALRPVPEIEQLAGEQPLRFLVRFDNWTNWSMATRAAKDAGERFFRVTSAVDQALMMSGRTLFKEMLFDDLVRVQLDIETIGFDPNAPAAQVIMVALRRNDGFEEILTLGQSEAELIEQLNERIQQLDPDVIEGHNIFDFDIPFLAARATHHGLQLNWGRDRSPVWVGANQRRFKVAALTLPFTPSAVFGRHIVDTYQQIQRYDTGGQLTSYGLKNAIDALGLTRSDREFVPGEQIHKVWQSDRDRLHRYALDDVRDVDMLSRLALPTEFYQTQLLPRSLQSTATGGPGEKINDLMLRAYLQQRQSIPLPTNPRDYPGGLAELLETGVFNHVVKCDVESLYPSIMLAEEVTSKGDTLGAYLPMLRDLTRRRLEAKAKSRDTIGAEQAMWQGLQASFKVLINSFYGYLGYSRGLFNDYDAAERITLSGQRLIKRTVAALKEQNARPIEVDTDGVFFVPPPSVHTEEDEHQFIDLIGSVLPAGIRLAHDGRFQAMLSLRLKTYGLLTYDDRIILKGSALRSRRMEPCFRMFLEVATKEFLRDQPDEARKSYFDLAERILARKLTLEEFSQWAMLHDETARKQPRLKRLMDRYPGKIRTGERVALYERQDGELALIDDYAEDENQSYLLRRLHETAARFTGLFDSDTEFEAFFPKLTPRSNVDMAIQQQAAHQLGLF